jgi:hypothetical protein
MDVGVAAPRRALLRSPINVYDPTTVELLSCLQNVHDGFGHWELAGPLVFDRSPVRAFA